MVGSLARLLSIVSLALCAIVIASFAIFVVDETKSASGQQQEQLTAANGTPVPAGEAPIKPKPGRIHRTIDEAAATITAPFADVVSSSSGEWAERGAKLLLALALYGFGLGFLARMLRVHV